ncbi:MAG TPA: flavodoxin domain-containing protein [bacterium]
MKILIVYDSVYGNTEKIARAMGDALGKGFEKDVELERAANWAREIVKAAG